MNRRTGDACKTKILEFWVDSEEGPWEAWIEDVVIKPQSYGGATGAISIPYNVNYDGHRVEGTVTLSGTDKRIAEFTKKS